MPLLLSPRNYLAVIGSIFILLFGLQPASAYEVLRCNGPVVTFDDDNFWEIEDITGNGKQWSSVAACGQGGNFTGGSGDALCVTSGIGVPAFETVAETPGFTLVGATSALLKFKLNYQDLVAGEDQLSVEIQESNGTWTPIYLVNSADVGTLLGTGSTIMISLNAYLGMSDINLRWRYVDIGGGNDSGIYVQIDDVELDCTGGADLQFSITPSQETVIEGADLSYTFNVFNAGPVSASAGGVFGLVPPGFVTISSQFPPLSSMVDQNANTFIVQFDSPLAAGDDLTTIISGRAGMAPEVTVTAVTPASIAGDFPAVGAMFGPTIDPASPITGAVVLAVDDAGFSPNDGCEPLTNAAQVSGKIALLAYPSSCSADVQVKSAQDAGAIAAIVGQVSPPFQSELYDPLTILVPSGDVLEPITIPTVGVSDLTIAVFQNNIVNSLSLTLAGVEVLSQQQKSRGYSGSPEFDPDFSFYEIILGGSSSNIDLNTVTVLKDSDKDGVPDIDDGCRKDAAKLSPAECGCGLTESDANANGIFDCLSGEELKKEIKSAKKFLKKLSPLSSAADAKKLKASLKRVVEIVQAPVIPIALVNPETDLEMLAVQARKKGNKAAKTGLPTFESNKKAASQAINKLLKALS